MKSLQLNDIQSVDQLIFPVYIYIELNKQALLFKIKNNYLIFVDNKIIDISYQSLKNKMIYYPENMDELFQLKNALDYIYNRLLLSIQTPKEKLLFENIIEIIERIDLLNEKILYKKLKIKFKDNQ